MSKPTGTLRWYERIPHPAILIFCLLIVVWVMTLIIPAGTFDRHEVNGRSAVIPGTFHLIDAAPRPFWKSFMSCRWAWFRLPASSSSY